MATRRAFIAGVGASLLACAAPAGTSSQRRLRRIGYLSGNVQKSVEEFSAPFLQKLRDLGYVEGRDVEVLFRIANQEMDRLPAMAAELVALPVDVIVAEAGPAQRVRT